MQSSLSPSCDCPPPGPPAAPLHPQQGVGGSPQSFSQEADGLIPESELVTPELAFSF